MAIGRILIFLAIHLFCICLRIGSEFVEWGAAYFWLSRVKGYSRDARLKALQDCILFLQAQKLGFTVLTANIADFDYVLQLVPTGRALFYRVGD